MPKYRLVFCSGLGESPISSICFEGGEARQALGFARGYDCTVELWLEGELAATLLRSGACRDVWAMSRELDEQFVPAELPFRSRRGRADHRPLH